MSNEAIKKAVFIKDYRWSEADNVDPLHEGKNLAFDLTQDFSEFDPKELARIMAALIAELPQKSVLIEDVFAEASKYGDLEGEAYSRPLVLASIWEMLVSADEAVRDIPETYHGAIQHALDCAFFAGQEYNYIEFREKFYKSIRQTVQRNNTLANNEGRTEHNAKKKEDAAEWQKIAVVKIEEFGHALFFKNQPRKVQADIIRVKLEEQGIYRGNGTISNWLTKYEKIHSYK